MTNETPERYVISAYEVKSDTWRVIDNVATEYLNVCARILAISATDVTPHAILALTNARGEFVCFARNGEFIRRNPFVG